jgi:MFS family permease
MTAGARWRAGRGVPAWWPRGWYYGWALVGTLGLTATVSYGILSYAFAAFITPMSAELGWSKTQITGAFSLGQLVAGAAAIPVGRWVDRHGARSLMTAGSVLAALLLVAWSQVRSLPAFYAVWSLIGVAMAAVFYEPAFAVVATWFRQGRGRALTVLTFLGGFASVVFVPLATVLIMRHGWRSALLALAGLYAILTVLPHAVILRRRPEEAGLAPDGAAPPAAAPDGTPVLTAHDAPVEPNVSARQVIRSPVFRRITFAFTLSALTTTAVAVHLVPLLTERGFGAGFAGGAMAVLGLMALPGRLIFTPLGDRWPRSAVTASIFALQAVGVAALLAARGSPAWGTASVWTFVILFGAGFGAITPARASLVAESFDVALYGRISGALALVVSLARAAAPVGASVLYATAGGPRHGYDAVLLALLLLCLASGAAVLSAGGPARPLAVAPLPTRASS